MTHRWFAFGSAAIAALVVLLVGGYLLSPLVISRTVNEAFPPVAAGTGAGAMDESTLVRAGQFHGVVHEGSGRATVVRQADGTYALRLEEFAVLNGPDLYVYLSALPDATTSAPILSADYLSIAQLKGDTGASNFA